MDRDDLSLMLEKALARGARAFGFELLPRLTYAAPSLDILDLVIRDLMERVPDIYFLQIGAHDGLTYDPISAYVRQHHWHGLLVEPQPAVFQRLVQNYAGEPQLRFENSAIAREDGTIDLHVFRSVNPDDHASMLASTRRHYLTLNGDQHRGALEKITLPALSLAHLLDKHGVTRVNLLQIDTEGFDFEIIRMIDFARIKPDIINFESNFLNRRQRSECARLLGDQGYSMINLGIDTIAYLQQASDAFAGRAAMTKIAPV